jgi:hypothetical protein
MLVAVLRHFLWCRQQAGLTWFSGFQRADEGFYANNECTGAQYFVPTHRQHIRNIFRLELLIWTILQTYSR